jgi:hypothetical protein
VVPRRKTISSSRLLVGVGGLLRQVVHPTVNVGVETPVALGLGVECRLRLLSRGGVVEIGERLAVDGLVERREVGTDALDVEGRALVRGRSGML